MIPKERIATTFKHQEPDQVPVFEIHVNSGPASEILGRFAQVGYGGYVRGKLYNEALLAGRLDEFYHREMEDRLALCRATGLDNIRAAPYDAHPPLPEPIGERRWRTVASCTPWTGIVDRRPDHWAIYHFDEQTDFYTEVDSGLCHNGLAEFEQLVEELESYEPSLERISFRNLELVVDKAPDLCKLGLADVSFPTEASWLHIFLEAIGSRPDLVDRYMAANLRQILLVLEAQLQRGADLILGGQDFCYRSGPMFSPRHYQRFIQPGLRAMSELCHRYGVPYVRHNDGNIHAIEEEFLLRSGIDGWHAIEPQAGNDIFYFKEKYGDKITLLGNIDCGGALVSGTPEDVKQEVREKIRRCAPGGGYILSSSNSIHNEIPTRNYLAMLEAAREYGRYPITA